MAVVVETEKLTKRFGGVDGILAVDGLSLRVKKGEVYGFVGLNGAGKTTTIRMLLGMIRPTGGRVRLFETPVGSGRPRRASRSPKGRAVWSRVGYIVETPHSYPELTVAQNLEIVRRLRAVPDRGAPTSVMERLGLSRYRDVRAGVLSLGNKQRLGLAKALLHDPELLILDEPTNGLDPAGIVEVRRLLRNLAEERGVTIFLSSHLLGEVAKLVDRLGIIHEGRLVAETNWRRVERSLRRRLLIEARDGDGAAAILRRAGYDVRATGDGWHVGGRDAAERPDEVAALLVRGGAPPTRLQVKTEDLESYFLRIVRGASKDQ